VDVSNHNSESTAAPCPVELKESLNRIFLYLCALLLVVMTLFLWVMLETSSAKFVVYIVMSYSCLSIIRLIFYIGGAVKYDFRERNKVCSFISKSEEPLISILVPAYNESLVIKDVIKGYDSIDYTNYEIIIVDDGSSDNTYEIAKEAASHSNLNISVYFKVNGGKASALNYALEKSLGDFVLCMDADSKLSPGTLKAGISHFLIKPNLAAVAGIVKVENRTSFLTKMQYLDYLVGHFQRKAFSNLSLVSIVPGPIGLFRKEFIKNIGGYEKENTTFAEDTELTLRLLADGHDIICDDDMIAYTEAPISYTDLFRQRYRWTRGIYQALLKNTYKLIMSTHTKVHILYMFLMWEQVIIPVIDFFLLCLFVFHFIFSENSFIYSLLFLYVAFIDVIITVLATKGEKGRFSLVLYSIVGRFTYANILSVWKISSFIDEWNVREMSWDKLERNGFTDSIAVPIPTVKEVIK
jgi:cellulose synthase/poly-beta-1,6-N-acetylglucosamine synthase-like glycosyltransferase